MYIIRLSGCTTKVDADSQNIIGHMCYAASKLWNEANYGRMNWKSPGPAGYPDWYVQKKELKGDIMHMGRRYQRSGFRSDKELGEVIQ